MDYKYNKCRKIKENPDPSSKCLKNRDSLKYGDEGI